MKNRFLQRKISGIRIADAPRSLRSQTQPIGVRPARINVYLDPISSTPLPMKRLKDEAIWYGVLCMRIRILSDLHLDTAPLDLTEHPSVDVVVLAGDIQRGLEGLRWAINTFSTPVIYVPGNHEYYEQRRPQFLSALKQAANGTHVHVLDQDTVTINGVDFFGATLWTDFRFYETPDTDMAYAQRNVLDFHIIEETEQQLFSPQRSAELFLESVQWIDTILRNSSARKKVVITHHAPSAKSVVSRFAGSPLNPAFASRLEPLIEKYSIDLWIHGHMHTALDYELHGTRVICNPRGYQPYEICNGFELNKIIDIDVAFPAHRN